MRIYALCNAQGTAMAETALCEDHSDPANRRNARLLAMHEPGGGPHGGGTGFIDCTGNDALACTVCGATSDTPREVTTTIWYVGATPQDAAQGMPFDDPKFAEDFMHDNNEAHVYAVDVTGLVAEFREVV